LLPLFPIPGIATPQRREQARALQSFAREPVNWLLLGLVKIAGFGEN